tara:strand:+ start:7531 stop:8046 length:516 start_codon:yes stop_codon:yes gene_type:complete
MNLKKNIVLSGMMGSGKTTIGAILSKKLKLDFIDIDKKIEINENKKITEIFKVKGETYFRKLETGISISYLKKDNQVISLGGGGFLNESIRKECKKKSISFWLNWNKQTLIRRILKNSKRPVLFDLNEGQIEKLINDRNNFYSKSDYEITCENHKKNEIVDKIISILKNEN